MLHESSPSSLRLLGKTLSAVGVGLMLLLTFQEDLGLHLSKLVVIPCAVAATALGALLMPSHERGTHHNKHRLPWREVAARLKLRYTTPPEHIFGELHGIEIDALDRGLEGTIIALRHPMLDGIIVRDDTHSDAQAQASEIKIGDLEFDAQFLISGDDAAHVRDHLKPEHRRLALLELREELLRPEREGYREREGGPLLSLGAITWEISDGALTARFGTSLSGQTLQRFLTLLTSQLYYHLHGVTPEMVEDEPGW